MEYKEGYCYCLLLDSNAEWYVYCVRVPKSINNCLDSSFSTINIVIDLLGEGTRNIPFEIYW